MQIEIWSDLICPWCYIGKRRFESAMSSVKPAYDIQIVWRSFELDPQAPTHLTETLEQMLARKYGVSTQQAAEMNANVTQQAASVGLKYDLSNALPGNTFAAHRLIHYAATLGLGEKLMERLMKGYFCESLPIGNHVALTRVATNVGLDAEKVQTILASNEFEAKVRADEQRARQIGVRGVPFFLFNEKQAISGAQPLEVFEQAFVQATSGL